MPMVRVKKMLSFNPVRFCDILYMDFNFGVLSYMCILFHRFYVGPDLMGFIRIPTYSFSFSGSKHNMQLILFYPKILISFRYVLFVLCNFYEG